MKIAIVADWLPTYAGAEHVLGECCAIWPNSPIFTTIANKKNLGPLAKKDIRTNRILQFAYSIIGNHKVLLPWMPRAIEQIDLTGFDIVISSSHAIGKGIVPPSNCVHICYCHTPMRYAWEMEDQYLTDFRIPRFARKRIKKLLMKLRKWDLTTAKRTDVFFANSSETAKRIRRIYNRDSIVIHPPVEDVFFSHAITKAETGSLPYFVAIGRMVPYKRFDLLIEAANTLQIPLKIAGTGDMFDTLKKKAGPTVEMLGYVPQEELAALYTNASALLFPQIEDAGVVPLEAQACGTPVIALGKGGALDTIQDGVTGIFFEEQTIASLTHALERFKSMTFDHQAIREHARQYSATRFRERLEKEVNKLMS